MNKLLLLTISMLLGMTCIIADETVPSGDRQLQYTLPDGWIHDESAIANYGLYDFLVPEGGSIETSDYGVTIMYQPVIPGEPVLESLSEFYNAGMQSFPDAFPEVTIEPWRPVDRPDDGMVYMSCTVYDKPEIVSVEDLFPRRLMYIDAGAGYYIISANAPKRSELPMFDDFFNSIMLAPIDQETDVTAGPNFQKGQSSATPLRYTVPSGWVIDEEGASAYGLYAVVLPEGEVISSTRAAITIAFQKKAADDPILCDLASFVDADLAWTRSQHPDAQIDAWPPDGANASETLCQGYVIYSNKARSRLSPCIVVFIDAGDGYYSVVATENAKHKLESSLYQTFFQSLHLGK